MYGLTEIVWNLSTLGSALAALRMICLGLGRVYGSLLAYLIVLTIEAPVLMLAGRNTNTYAWLYLAFQTVNVITATLVVLALYRSALAERPALASYARSLAGYIILGTAALVGVSAMLDYDSPKGRSRVLYHYFRFERSMDLIVVFLLLTMAVFLTWFPVKIKRNVLLFGGGFFIFYVARASGLLLTNLLSPAAITPISNLMLLLSFGCMAYWLISMRREKEDVSATTSFHRNPERLAELTRQLDLINSAVSRFSRH